MERVEEGEEELIWSNQWRMRHCLEQYVLRAVVAVGGEEASGRSPALAEDIVCYEVVQLSLVTEMTLRLGVCNHVRSPWKTGCRQQALVGNAPIPQTHHVRTQTSCPGSVM